MRLRLAALSVLLVPATLPPLAGAQMADLRTVRLADSVYAIVRSTRPADPSDANTLVIVNASDVIVVDGNITPRSTRAVIAEIRKLTNNPVRYVVVTHAHSDHHTGNVEYRRAWPGVEFIAHHHTREEIVERDIPAFISNTTDQYPREIARLRKQLTAGVNDAGTALKTTDRERIASDIAALEYFIEETASFRPIPPTLTFSDSLVLHRGERSIVLRYLGEGNTRGDVVVELPRERVLATGDLVVSPVPFGFESHPMAWSETLSRMRRIPADVILPGHGEPMRDWRYVEQLQSLLCAVIREGVAPRGASEPLDSLMSRMPLRDEIASFAAGDDRVARAVRGAFVRPALEGLELELQRNPRRGVPGSCK